MRPPGNLAGHLWFFTMGLKEYSRSPIDLDQLLLTAPEVCASDPHWQLVVQAQAPRSPKPKPTRM